MGHKLCLGTRNSTRTSKLVACVLVGVGASAATALLEISWNALVLVSLFMGVLITEVLNKVFVKKRITWRADVLMIGAALLYPAVTAIFLQMWCHVPLPIATSNCTPEVLRRLSFGNFYFCAIGLLGTWAAYRFDLWHSTRKQSEPP